jgi:hypothetical protein
MSKLETARQLAQQTNEPKPSTATPGQPIKQQQPESDTEVQDFLKTLHYIHLMSDRQLEEIQGLKQKIVQVEKNHWKQIRLLVAMIPCSAIDRSDSAGSFSGIQNS